MTAAITEVDTVGAGGRPAQARWGTRLWGGAVAFVGVSAGVASHVLHHVGPLAGAALFAGFGGQVLFFILGLVLSVPLLLRLYRRFETLLAPAVAVGAFAAIFTLSSVVVAPLLTGSDESPVTPIEQLHDDGHHPAESPP
jgi:hypothetical protein